MKVQLLVARDCPSCDKAKALWRRVCREHGLVFEVLDVDRAEGGRLFQRWDLSTVPALLVNERLMAVGVQNREQALTILHTAGGRAGPPPPA